MKKVVLTVAALVVSAAMVFSFAGCSKDDSDDGKNPSNPVSQSEEATDSVA